MYRRGRPTWATLGVLAGLGLLLATIGTILPYPRRELDLGYAAASLHMTAMALGSIVGALVVPPAQRAIGRTRLILLGALGTTAAGVGLVLAGGAALTLAA